MAIATRFTEWRHTYLSFLLLITRALLGVILMMKGIFFISQSQDLKELIMQSHFAAGVGFFTAYITFAHLFGGVFLVIGLFTRLVAHSFRRHFLYYTSAKNSRFRVRLYFFQCWCLG